MGLINDTLKERGGRYGDFIDNAHIAQGLKLVVQRNPRWATLDSDVREGIHNIFAKISRIVTGDQYYTDNYLDIEGYARLIRERIEKRNEMEKYRAEFNGMVDFLVPDPGDGPQDRQDGDTGGSSIVGLV